MDMMGRIRDLMDANDLNQSALANISGVSKGTVSQWFNGGFTPKAESLAKIADHFGVTVEYLMSGRDERTRVAPSQMRMVPVRLLGTTYAGEPGEPCEFCGEAMLYEGLAERHPNCYALCVSGTCMDRLFTEQDYVFVDPDMEPRDGSVAVMLIDGKSETRRVKMGNGSMMLVSESHDPQPDIIIRDGDGQEAVCQGVVFWWQAREELA